MKLGQYQREQLGEFLKNYRTVKQVTQRQIADHLGHTSNQYISNVERGLAEPPEDMLRAAIKLYGIPEKVLISFILDLYRDSLKEALE